MTVQHQRRYTEAIHRNVWKFWSIHDGPLSHSTPHLAHFAGMELEDLKHHLGIRKNDSYEQSALETWLGKQHASAKKNNVKPSFKKRGGHAPVDGVLAESGELIDVSKAQAVKSKKPKVGTEATSMGDAEFMRKMQSAGKDLEFPHAKGHNVKSNNINDLDYTAVVEGTGSKKINPKKAARLAAAEAIGSSPNKTQKVNADAKRAEFMAGQTQRQPRILAKNK